jgi:Tfp pilus assembly protein FimV
MAGCLVGGVFVATWFGADALVAGAPVSAVAVKGATPVHGGYVYVIRPGDTLWSIATEVDPNGDPRALVDQLSAQLGGATPVPGEKVRLP